MNVTDLIVFTGGIVPERVPEYLERSDIFVLASETEGWPKSIAEAMAFGLVCIGSDRGLVPKFLAQGRGLTVHPKDLGGLVDALRRVATSPTDYKEMRQRASQWAQVYSIEHLRDALQALLVEWWQPAEARIRQHNRSHLLS